MVAIHRYDSDGTSGSETVDDTAPNNNNTNNNPENLPPGSWRGWKERGKLAYLKGDYASALQNYSQALQRQNNIYSNVLNGAEGSSSILFPSRLDRQILLSNMVACRLKLGGAPQAEAAVANAQKCISIDSTWAKGHMRLAEAHLGLGKSTTNSEKRIESSSRACEALQKVIDLDPTNQTARNMLTKELRFNNLHGESESQRAVPEPSAPPEHMDENRSSNSSSNNSYNDIHSSTSEHPTRSNEEHNRNQHRQEEDNTDGIDIEDESNYVFTPSWQDHLAMRVQKARTWYGGLSENEKSLVKVALTFVVLYVAFGGRFGMEYLGKSGIPSRRSNSVYDDFYQNRNANHHRHDTSYGHQGGSNSHSSYSSNYRHHDHSSSSSWLGGNTWGSSSRNSSSYFGGNTSYMLLVLGLSYIGQRFFGIGPYQVMFFVNMLMGRRNGMFAPRRQYGWGHGMNFGARPRYGHRPRGMWR